MGWKMCWTYTVGPSSSADSTVRLGLDDKRLHINFICSLLIVVFVTFYLRTLNF